MKKGFLMWFFVAACMVACDDDDSNDDDKKSTDQKVTEVQNIAVTGQWRITGFVDSGVDETSQFDGYIFGFESNYIITATNGSSNFPGTWSVTSDDNSNDDTQDDFDDIDFNIAFTSPANFQELSEDWEIVLLSDNKIELRHISGGNGGNDLLTFEKI